MIVRDTLYIDGRWVRPHGQGSLEVTDSSTGKPWARVPEGNADDANAAVAAARRAFDGWAATAPAACPVAMQVCWMRRLACASKSHETHRPAMSKLSTPWATRHP